MSRNSFTFKLYTDAPYLHHITALHHDSWIHRESTIFSQIFYLGGLALSNLKYIDYENVPTDYNSEKMDLNLENYVDKANI